MASNYHTTYASPNESHRDTHSQIMALQAQLAQITQRQSDNIPALANQDSSSGAEQYLTFTLMEQEFAIKAAYIQGVERPVEMTLVPNIASWVYGVINMRGSILSVVDLRSFLDLDPLPLSPRTRLLSIHYNGMAICFIVDSVNEMLPISVAAIRNGQVTVRVPSWVAMYASESALLNRRGIVLLDIARLLFSDKLQHYQTLR